MEKKERRHIKGLNRLNEGQGVNEVRELHFEVMTTKVNNKHKTVIGSKY